jgi:hypothetical protein
MIDILVLTFKKKEALQNCLFSIKQYVHIPHRVIVLDNCPQDSIAPYEKARGRIDIILDTGTNIGCGLGTTTLFNSSKATHCITMQNDTFFMRSFTEIDRDKCIGMLSNHFCVDLAGDQGQGKYSERGVFWERQRYLDIPNMPIGGPGPYDNFKWTEEHIQDYIKENSLKIAFGDHFIGDFGKTTVRQNADGSVWEQKTDTKELRLISGSPLCKSKFPSFTEEEWNQVIATGSWPQWQVPSNQVKDSFRYWSHK